jgi:hypothetical protein
MDRSQEISLSEFIQQKLVYIFIALVVATIGLFFILRSNKKEEEKKEEVVEEVKPKKVKEVQVEKTVKKVKKEQHPLQVSILKGNTKNLVGTAYSPSGKWIATVSGEERILRIFPTKSILENAQKYSQIYFQKEIIEPNNLISFSNSFLRINLTGDPTACAFSADGNHIIVALANPFEIIAYRISSKVCFEKKSFFF